MSEGTARLHWRWSTSDWVPRSRVAAARQVHSALSADSLTLCERDESGDMQVGADVVLLLDRPDVTPEDRASVTCPGCVEWLRA